MTSAGRHRVTWQPGGQMRDEVSGRGGDVHGSRARTWAGQVSPYRDPSCTVKKLSDDAPTELGRAICPHVTQASDKYRKVSVRRVGCSDIDEGRRSGGARSNGCRAINLHEPLTPAFVNFRTSGFSETTACRRSGTGVI